MPTPAKAAIRCSIVPTLTPLSAPIVVHRRVHTTRSQRARIAVPPPSMSVRTKRMPLSGSPGARDMVTRAPLCRPTPEQSMRLFSVR